MSTTYQGPDAERIRSMFSDIAAKYDRANDVLSLGIHHLWRRKVVRLAQVAPGMKVLDCATGTGDLAIAFKKAVGREGTVVGTDFCSEMLTPAPQKARKAGVDVSFSVADVMALPFSDQVFDVASISFGIRNVAEPARGLTEMARVVKPGGRVIVLEFGQVSLPLVKEAYELYSQKVLPWIGGKITGHQDAYNYLQRSSANFPAGPSFTQMMTATGRFSRVEDHPLQWGLAHIYIGWVA